MYLKKKKKKFLNIGELMQYEQNFVHVFFLYNIHIFSNEIQEAPFLDSLERIMM